MSAPAITERGESERPLGIRGLYAITPDTTDTPWLVAAVRAAVRGGASAIQYRNKSASDALRRTQAHALVEALAGSGVPLIVNDDAALAGEVGAQGVHLGEDDGELAVARARAGAAAIVGVSCYNDLARARTAVAAGADYVAFGSFFASSVKPGARRAKVELLREARELGVPVVAIGGITADNAATLRHAGADAVAIISAVFGAGDERATEAAARTIASVYSTERHDET